MATAILRLTTGVVYARSISGTLTFNSGSVAALADGTAAAPSLTFASDTTKGIYSSATNVIAMALQGSIKYSWDTSSFTMLSSSAALKFGGSADVILSRVADGKLQLAGSSNTTPMLLLGGSTSSFPAWKRNSSGIEARLADDSGYANITGSTIFVAAGYNNSTLMVSKTAPTISSGFGTNPSIAASNGTAAFTVNVGTGGSASSGVIGLPTATTGWICHVENLTATAAGRADQRTVQTASSTTSITVQNQTVSTGAALAWTASDVLRVTCMAY